MGDKWWERQQSTKKHRFRTYALCSNLGCNRYRFHDRIGSETQCLCGTKWSPKDMEWAQWHHRRNRGDREWKQGDREWKQPDHETESLEKQFENLKQKLEKTDTLTVEGLDQLKLTVKPKEEPIIPAKQAFRNAEKSFREASNRLLKAQSKTLGLADDLANLRQKLADREEAWSLHKLKLAECEREAVETKEAWQAAARQSEEEAQAQARAGAGKMEVEEPHTNTKTKEPALREKYAETEAESKAWATVTESLKNFFGNRGGQKTDQECGDDPDIRKALDELRQVLEDKAQPSGPSVVTMLQQRGTARKEPERSEAPAPSPWASPKPSPARAEPEEKESPTKTRRQETPAPSGSPQSFVPPLPKLSGEAGAAASSTGGVQVAVDAMQDDAQGARKQHEIGTPTNEEFKELQRQVQENLQKAERRLDDKSRSPVRGAEADGTGQGL